MPRPRQVPVARGDHVDVTAAGLGDGPDALARLGDYVVFVPGLVPGESARVEITSAARKFGRARLLQVTAPAADRVVPRCPHFLDCGGCHWQHLAYPAQLRHKSDRLQRLLAHALGADAPQVAATVPAASPFGERHKVAAHLVRVDGRLAPALHRARSPELTVVHECPASDPLAWDLVVHTIECLDRLGHGAWDPWFAPQALLRTVLVRTTTAGEAHLVLVATAPRIPGLERLLDDLHRAGATSISVNHNPDEPARLLGPATALVSGRPFVHERVAGLEFRLGPTSFFQTSPRMAEQLAQQVVAWLQPTAADDVADLYCGVGLLSLPLARHARSVHGVESNPAAVADARASAAANGLRNATFRSGTAAAWLADCRRGTAPPPQLVALDPPRSGLDAGVVEALRQLAPRRLAYVSCEPQSLQRDLPALGAAGFRIRAVVPFDMFPQTAHVESLACLERDG